MISTLKTKLENYAPNGSLEDHPQAAVLIICYEAEGELFIVMTERSKNLPSHPGEVAYPGGKKEKNDSSLIAIAEEKLNLKANASEVEEIFHIPLSFFKNKPNISEKITNFKGETFKTPVFNFEKYKIWGLTLAFTINFLDLLDIKFDYDL